jgi:hypothetical protein
MLGGLGEEEVDDGVELEPVQRLGRSRTSGAETAGLKQMESSPLICPA